MLSSVSLSCPLMLFNLCPNPGMQVVRQISGDIEQSKLSRSTDRLPDTVIWPCNSEKRENRIQFIEFLILSQSQKHTSCSFNRSPMIVKLSPSNCKWAATSDGCVPGFDLNTKLDVVGLNFGDLASVVATSGDAVEAFLTGVLFCLVFVDGVVFRLMNFELAT